MKKFSKTILLSAVLSAFTMMPVSSAFAANEQASNKETVKVPAMRSKVYEQLARAQGLADEGKPQEAIEALDNVNGKRSSMNSYEIAMMHNFYAFVYYNMENMPKAIENFELVVSEQAIPESLRLSTLYSLAQLHMAESNYAKSIEKLEQWFASGGDADNANALVLLAQAQYQQKKYKAALKPLIKAIKIVSDAGNVPKENWFVLQRAIYYSLEMSAEVADVTDTLVRLFNKPEYWLQLAGMYGELGLEDKQLAMMEVAYQQGFVENRQDILALAQLYVYHQVPVKGALLLEKAIADGKIKEDVKNLKFLAQAYTLAREEKKAVPVLAKAANLSEDGNLDAQLGQTYLNLEQWDKAIASTQTALDKGELDDPGKAQLVLGMAYFNLKKFDASLKALQIASEHSSSKAMAQQWKKYVAKEKQNAEAMAAISA
ncbi:tetratricopeptide repeat protein [Catenovulum adriaticum]|uniref:Tetratricopeptide repeat protein n=1 Tax=Catenovulum adriaticum TaxID=2984846 RepID=A0ABY7AJN0_9ALTE|nr:tetratricopeptide repeat protein [Catenovulum sp. TS8]WAJ69772.1 tetratricopeptide repeat protein [Catenovulum sp. TS8]